MKRRKGKKILIKKRKGDRKEEEDGEKKGDMSIKGE